MELLDDVDPRLKQSLAEAFRDREQAVLDGLPRGVTIVLAGHRAAGKTRLLPKVGALLHRPTVDLDAELERVHGRPLREWVSTDMEGFRRAELEGFAALPAGVVVAVGGGFLATHPEALFGCITVLVPVSFETYVDRLRADTTRPRLRPHLSMLDELREVFFEREQKHTAFRPMSLVEFAVRARRPQRPRRVVTLPPATNAFDFAWRARRAGADLLEVRTDLTDLDVDLKPVARALPLLIAERTQPIPEAWQRIASLVDRPLGANATLASVHAEGAGTNPWPLTLEAPNVKHVEPLTSLAQLPALLTLQQTLLARFPNKGVTVLATGALATAARAVLAPNNALDYCALDASWAAAPGQRLLADAVREARKTPTSTPARLAILGTHVTHSRSPQLHEQPFDRLELPEDVDLVALLDALRPYYRGFAVTAPFKQRAARAIGAKEAAINTLVRTRDGFRGVNSDVEGARVCLESLGATSVTVLGAGGVLFALQQAAQALDISLDVRRQSEDFLRPVRGAAVWTWPAHVEAPKALSFKQARVAVIAYGPPATTISQRIVAAGGTPVRLGPRWFIAQAREQRRQWREAEP